jgi:hypothetical protein
VRGALLTALLGFELAAPSAAHMRNRKDAPRMTSPHYRRAVYAKGRVAITRFMLARSEGGSHG